MIRPHTICERAKCSAEFHEHDADQRCPDGLSFFRKSKNHGRVSGSFSAEEISAIAESLSCVADGRPAIHVVNSDSFHSAALKVAKMTSRAKATASLRNPNRGAVQRCVLEIVRAHPQGVTRGDIVRAMPDHATGVDGTLACLTRKGLVQRVSRGLWRAIKIADVVSLHGNTTEVSRVAAQGEGAR